MAELKPCPFCGSKPVLVHSGIEKTRSRENGDLITRWKVRCQNCGTEKDGGATEYIFTKDEKLLIKYAHFNGREKAIEAWNRRYENG
jgi:Lar family restriction alleviation protein